MLRTTLRATFVPLTAMLMILCPNVLAAGGATTRAELAEGVGAGRAAHLSMIFKVTFLKIDVAQIETFLGPDDAAEIARISNAGLQHEDVESHVADRLLRATPCLITVRPLKGAPWRRFVSATSRNLAAAVKSNHITAAERDTLLSRFKEDFAALDKRGMKKGDAICYRIDGDRLRKVYLDDAGNVVAAADRASALDVRGARAAYFGPQSDFRSGLVASAIEAAPGESKRPHSGR